MAFLNYFKTESYTKIKILHFNKEDESIELIFKVLNEKDGVQLVPDIPIKISKQESITAYEETEKSKITHPGNTKPEDMTQADYEAAINAYTVATQQILEDAQTMNAFSIHFTHEALYTTSNIEKLCYEWCKNMPLFEGVVSDE